MAFGNVWLRYVPLAEIAQWLALGWEVADDMAGTHHGAYSVLMLYKSDDRPPAPAKRETKQTAPAR